MSTSSHSDRSTDSFWQTDAERRAKAEQTFWSMLGILWRRRILIVGVTGAAAVLSIVISLLMSNWYMAETRLLLPLRSGSSLFSAGVLGGDVTSSARSLLGGVSGDYLRYLSILDSRTVKEHVAQQFNLTEVYDLADSEAPLPATIEMLESNIGFVVDEEYNHLSVQVFDQDPQRAADMANFFVAELNRINASLASQSAGAFRLYVEERYEEAEAELDSLLNALTALQEHYGVLDLELQGTAFYTAIAELRLMVLAGEIEYERLLKSHGADHPLVQTAREAVRAANRKYDAALQGQERMMPVHQDSLPSVAHQFIEIKQQQLILAKIIEYSRPVLEEARLEEKRKIEAVQVVDVATPPAKKARPWRALIVVSATLSGFLLALIYTLLLTWWQRHHADFARRLKAASADPATPAPPPIEPSRS